MWARIGISMKINCILINKGIIFYKLITHIFYDYKINNNINTNQNSKLHYTNRRNTTQFESIRECFTIETFFRIILKTMMKIVTEMVRT